MRSIVPAIALILAIVAGGMVAGINQLGGPGHADQATPASSRATPTPPATPLTTPIPTSTPSPTASPIPAPSRQLATTWTYTAIAGDSLSLIAARYQTTTEQLVQLNPDFQEDRNELVVGDQVVVPCTPIAINEGRCG